MVQKTNGPILRKLTDGQGGRADPLSQDPSGHVWETTETTKKLYTLQELLVGGNRHDTWGRTGSRMCQKFVDVKLVLNFLKLMITIKHIKMVQILYLDIWSMLLLTSASYKLFTLLLQDAQRRASSNIVLEGNNLPPIIYCLFSSTDFNAVAQDIRHIMLHLNVA